jgi:gliding motility-associated-like protein
MISKKTIPGILLLFFTSGITQAQSSACPPLNIAGTAAANGSTQLNAASGYTSYSWSPSTGLSNASIQNPLASPGATTIYTCTAVTAGPNLVANPDFSSGNTGFTSSMNFSATVYTPCNYGVGPTWFGGYPQLTDHTATADNMYMAIDGCTTSAILWEQTVSGLQANTTYDFSFWASRADQVQPVFEVHFIDNSGDNVVATITGIPYTGVWTWDQYSVPVWNSGSNSNLTIRIINLQTSSYGNDFALDDFLFRTLCTTSSSVIVYGTNGVPGACPPVSITAGSTSANGITQLNATPGFTSYSWSPASGLSSTSIQNPLASPTVATTYTCTAVNIGPNLISNPDFSGGNTAFTSGMNFSATVYSPCNYGVGPTWFGGYPQLTDHTSTADNMYMAIDGCNAPTILWEQTVTALQQNTNHTFSFWASRADQIQPVFEIHFIDNSGDNVVATLTGIPYTGTWTWDQYFVPAWNSGSNSNLTIRVINLQTSAYGNDFALDDFSLISECVSTSTVTVNPPCALSAAISNVSDVNCAGGNDGSASVSVTPPGSNYTYTWLPSGGSSATAAGLSAGNYFVTVTDSAGCSATATVSITAPAPSANFSTSEIEAAVYNTEVFFYDASPGAVSWNWNFGDSTSSNLQNPVHVFTNTGVYVITLTVGFSNGCTESVVHSLAVAEEFTFYAPNTFTPDEDDLNEVFLPLGIGWDLNSYELRIFDRWGENIFYTTNALQGWNGKTQKGKFVVQQDVYVWRVRLRELNGKRHEYTGRVTLVK